LKSLVYGLPPLEAVLAWHLFLLRIAHRRHPAHVPAGTVPAAVLRPAVPEAASGRDETTGTAETGGPAHPPTVAGRRVPPPPQPAGAPAGTGRSRPAAAPQPAAGTDAGLLAQARAAEAEHRNTHGRPISRDALRQALRVSNQTAGALLRELRAGGTVADGQPEQADPDRQPKDQAGGVVVRTGEPSGGTEPAAVAGNGAGGPPAGLAALVPTVPVPASNAQEGTADA
jgi:hypothetical protein